MSNAVDDEAKEVARWLVSLMDRGSRDESGQVGVRGSETGTVSKIYEFTISRETLSATAIYL